jgi:signal transduction histidine kinase
VGATYQEGKEQRQQPHGRIGRKLVLSFVLLIMVVVGGSGWVLFKLTERSLERQMSERLIAIAQLVSSGPNGEVLRHLRPGAESYGIYKRLTAQLRQAKEMVGARRIYVFDQSGRSLLDTEEGFSIGREYHNWIRDRLELEQVWQGIPAHSVRFKDEESGIDYMTGYAPIYAGGQVVAAVGVDIGAAFMDTIHVFKRSVFVLAGASALLTIVVALGLARTITRPIQRLVTAAREIGRGNLEKAVDTSAQDELGYLGETMDEMRRKLLERDAQLRQMLGGVAHEIRNPLGGIEIYAGLIADDLPEGDTRKQHIQKVIGEVRTLNQVISEFLDFARPAPPSPEPIAVGQLVEDAAFLLAPDMEKAGIRYRQDVAAELRGYGDTEQIKRALFNLMKNAVQAMRRGGELQVQGTRRNGEVVIEVRDTGPGMSRAVQERLFEPFFSTREKGSGLGMAIVQQALEKNRGRVELQSTEGQGTTITMILPAQESHEGELN